MTNEGWKRVDLSKEEEEGFALEETEVTGDDAFKNSLVGKLWTVNPFNTRVFKQVIVQSWRLKNPVEVQDLNKNLFLFRFSSKRDVDSVMKSGPWSFDRNLLVLKKISGEEQPSEMEMNTTEFWTRVYDLPLKLRTDATSKKLGDTIGKFVEVDPKDVNRLGKFLRVKAEIDLKKPLKRGTVIKYQGKSLRVFFKYERLPNFCYICGRVGHQIKDCDEGEGHEDVDFDDIEEKDLPFGLWMRASPLPRITGEIKTEQSSSSCTRSLFSDSSNSRGTPIRSGEREVEVEQLQVQGKEMERAELEKAQHEVESVAESLGNVVLSKDKAPTFDLGSHTKPMAKTGPKKGRTWIRKQNPRKGKKQQEALVAELGKRQLVDVNITEVDPMELCVGEKKKRNKGDENSSQNQEVVLDDQHRLIQ